jgi:DNA polymerase-3 subunit delta'
MIPFDRILGQRKALDLLERMLDHGRLPHALLFQGPEGVGKGTVARSFAAALLCDNPEPQACGACPACRLVDAGAHPDFLLVERLPRKPPSRELRHYVIVDQIRQVSRLASMSPRQGPRRVFVLDPADRMNLEAQNALLKTLEEPPGQAVLILVAARPRLLLPTVRSRTFNVGFGPLRPSDLADALRRLGFDAEEAVVRAALSAGCPGLALDLDLETLLEWRGDVLEALESLTRSPAAAADLPSFAAHLAGKNEVRLRGSLDLIEALLRDAAVASAGAEHSTLAHTDIAAKLERIGNDLGPRRAAEIIEALERLRHDLRFNLNRTLVVESLLAAVAGGPVP